MPYPVKFTPQKKKEFLRLLSETGNVFKTCKALNLDRPNVYAARKRSARFAEQWDAAKQMYIALLEDEAWRRAFEGVDKGIWYQGERVGVEKQYSDTLLMHRLNAEKPDKYQYRHKVDANVQGNITVEVVKFADENTDSE